MKKKTLGLALCFALAATMLAGCTSEEGGNTGSSLGQPIVVVDDTNPGTVDGGDDTTTPDEGTGTTGSGTVNNGEIVYISDLTAPAGYVYSELTGELIDEKIAEQRPLAVMVDNELTALDHFGVNDCDIVYETMNKDEADSKGIQVYIGDESPMATMKDCSVVTATYELGEGMKGTIGIIGPKRMDYDKVVKTLKSLTGQIDAIYKKDK